MPAPRAQGRSRPVAYTDLIVLRGRRIKMIQERKRETEEKGGKGRKREGKEKERGERRGDFPMHGGWRAGGGGAAGQKGARRRRRSGEG